MLEVGDNQFLVLLLVLQTEFEQCPQRGILVGRRDERREMALDVSAVGVNLVQRRARQQAAFRPRVPVANGVVVRVEKHPKLRVKRQVRGRVALQHESFEEPRRMGQMPLTGLASGIDCSAQSSADSGAASFMVVARTASKRCRNAAG